MNNFVDTRTNFTYRDLNLYFTRNPVTGDISTVSDTQDIKRAVRNLVLLNAWEKPFHPEISTGIRDSLFENFTPPIIAALRSKIESTIKVYEPRVTVQAVEFDDPDGQRLDTNSLSVRIEFYINNYPNILEEINVILKRVR